MRPHKSPALLLFSLLTTPALAQPTVVQYDAVTTDALAAVTCGFCAGEKFGAIFYELPGGVGLLRSAFPITLNSVQFAVAGIEITGDIISGYTCQGTTAGGMIDVSLEVYAGAQPPTNIANLPATGPWPGESVIFGPANVTIERSRDMTPGGNMWDVKIAQINMPNNGVLIGSPNTYVRAVVTIPAGGVSSACSDLALTPPGGVPFRDNNGVAGPNTNFIYQTGIFGSPSMWTWNEAVQDPVTGGMGINGDWLIRLEVTPDTTPTPDAGVPDIGPGIPDLGEEMDAGVVDTGVDTGVVVDMGASPLDSGVVGPVLPPEITAISPDKGRSDQATMVTVTGNNFVNGLTLKIGAIAAGGVDVPGPSTIRAMVPQGIVAGEYDVIVENPDGQAAILSKGFTVEGDAPPLPEKKGCVCVKQSREQVWGSGGAGLFALMLLGLVWRRKR